MEKAIKIRCEAKEYFDLEDLKPFQGKLKSISTEAFHKLKESIRKDGIPLAFHVWKDKNNTWIMDGHHRFMALQSLQDEGYFVPPIPANIVEAKTKKEAAKVVLISNSRYAKISQESLSDYMIDNELSLEDIEFADIPELNMEDYKIEEKETKNTGAEIDLNSFNNFQHQCPKCGFEWDENEST